MIIVSDSLVIRAKKLKSVFAPMNDHTEIVGVARNTYKYYPQCNYHRYASIDSDAAYMGNTPIGADPE